MYLDRVAEIPALFRPLCHKLGLYGILFNAHAPTWLISTSGLKSEVTTVFPDPSFPYNAGIPGNSRTFKAEIGIGYLCVHGFSGTFGPKWRLWGQNRGRGGTMLTPTNTFLLSGLLPPCHFWRKSIKKCGSESAHRQRQTHAVTETN